MDKEGSNKADMRWTWFMFSFTGRISRKQFWMFNLIVMVGWMILMSLTGAPVDTHKITRPQLMFMAWILWPSLAVQAKRWHDCNKSALWIFINFIPLAGPLWALIENGFVRGTRGPNRFGPDPTEEGKKGDR